MWRRSYSRPPRGIISSSIKKEMGGGDDIHDHRAQNTKQKPKIPKTPKTKKPKKTKKQKKPNNQKTPKTPKTKKKPKNPKNQSCGNYDWFRKLVSKPIVVIPGLFFRFRFFFKFFFVFLFFGFCVVFGFARRLEKLNDVKARVNERWIDLIKDMNDSVAYDVPMGDI